MVTNNEHNEERLVGKNTSVPMPSNQIVQINSWPPVTTMKDIYAALAERIFSMLFKDSMGRNKSNKMNMLVYFDIGSMLVFRS